MQRFSATDGNYKRAVFLFNNNNNCRYLPRKLHSPESGLREVLHPIELEFGNADFLRRGENRRTRRKTSRSRVKN